MSDRPVFPEVRITAERVVLRQFTLADLDDLQRMGADERSQYWTTLPSPYTLDNARQWALEQAPAIREHGAGIVFAIADCESDRLLASIDLKGTDWVTRVTEVGYMTAPWARGRGYAAEAAHALGRWALLDQRFERLELKAATGNHASQRVAEKAGFTREGVLRNAGVTKNDRVDLAMFSLVPDDLP